MVGEADDGEIVSVMWAERSKRLGCQTVATERVRNVFLRLKEIVIKFIVYNLIGF